MALSGRANKLTLTLDSTASDWHDRYDRFVETSVVKDCESWCPTPPQIEGGVTWEGDTCGVDPYAVDGLEWICSHYFSYWVGGYVGACGYINDRINWVFKC